MTKYTIKDNKIYLLLVRPDKDALRKEICWWNGKHEGEEGNKSKQKMMKYILYLNLVKKRIMDHSQILWKWSILFNIGVYPSFTHSFMKKLPILEECQARQINVYIQMTTFKSTLYENC